MFIYNMKVNGSKIFKIFFSFVVVLIICILIIVVFKVFGGASKSASSDGLACVKQNGINQVNSQNYTNVLKAVHDNIDNYIGVKLNFTGYVYRLLDFNDNQFVLARNMVISSDFQTVVVGFLCDYEKAKDLEDDTWIEVSGEIVKGDYHGDMPILKIIDIKKADKPNDELVYPPDESYIPTSGLI